MKTLLTLCGWLAIWLVMTHGYDMDVAYKAYMSSNNPQDLVTMYYNMFYTGLTLAAATLLLWMGREDRIVVEVIAYEESHRYPTETNLGSDEKDIKA